MPATHKNSAYLIFGGTKDQRSQKMHDILDFLNLETKNNHPDVLKVTTEGDKKSIGIDKVRETTKFVYEKPFEKGNKAVIFEQANLLTIPAQNALLKTLEELPPYASVILGVKAENDVLETIISRCKKVEIRTTVKALEETQTTYTGFVNLSIGQRLENAESIAKLEREDIIEMLEKWIVEARTHLGAKENQLDIVNNIELLLKVKADLENTNVTLKLAIEFLAVSLV